MTEVTVTEFKANCSKLIEQIRSTRQPIRITRFGKHLAHIVPIPDEPLVDRASDGVDERLRQNHRRHYFSRKRSR
jgi:prevent-host-death family protein